MSICGSLTVTLTGNKGCEGSAVCQTKVNDPGYFVKLGKVSCFPLLGSGFYYAQPMSFLDSLALALNNPISCG